jgi:hypothetical protein
MLAKSPSKYVEIRLGSNGSPNASALFSNFQFSGGAVSDHYTNLGATGSFNSSFTMRCHSQSVSPQIIGHLGESLTQFSFNLELSTSCSTDDWFTLWLLDKNGNYFPSTATERLRLFASVSWNTTGEFTPAGYSGNGLIDGENDARFTPSVVPLF